MPRITRASLKEAYRTAHWRGVAGGLYFRAWFRRIYLRNTVFIGITGSAGKTTTKDLVANILSKSAPTTSTQRSLNTARAVARQVFRVDRMDRFCVVEMGAYGPGSLDWPVRLIKPRIAALIVVGRDHYRAFKSIDAIAREKAKLVKSLSADEVAVLNIDNEHIREIGKQCRCNIIWVGEKKGATLRLREATSKWPEPLRLVVEYDKEQFVVNTQLHGKHLSLSVLSALGIGIAAGVSLEKSISAVEEVEPTEGRMEEVASDDGVTFIRDDHKAPHWSLDWVLDFMREARADRKIAVCGMLSDFSGDSSAKYKAFAKKLRQCVDLAVFVGPHAHRAMRARESAEDRSIIGFGSVREAAEFLREELREGDLVLLKGSAKADHLVRIMLHRYQSVQCWRERCGREYFCTQCSLLYRPVEAGEGGDEAALSVDEFPSDSRAFARSSDSTVTVVAGLGNPGSRYRGTVHNVGQRVLDAIADRHDAEWREVEEGRFSSVSLAGDGEVLLFKPAAPMNRNGEALARFLVARGSNPDHCVIIHDDTDIEFGRVRFKRDGGDGGHKGIRSVITALGTDRVGRVRVGVRRPGENTGAAHRVLEAFSATEEEAMDQVLDHAVTVLEESVTMGVEKG